MGWASIPLYRMFCQATGLNGTTQRGTVAPGRGRPPNPRSISIPMSRRTCRGNSRPKIASETVAVGARDMAFFTATNTSDRPITGTATYNVTPAQAGKYFTKIQCFCFTQQTLKPGETARMPVIFFVDPKDPDRSRCQ